MLGNNLCQNSPPNNWEQTWLNWNATDQFHGYGFTIKVQGFQLEKKDNDNPVGVVRCPKPNLDS